MPACGHYTLDPSGVCNVCFFRTGLSTVGRSCERCARQGRTGKIEIENPDNWCPACLREAAAFGSDDMDRVRVTDAKRNNQAFFSRQCAVAAIEVRR